MKSADNSFDKHHSPRLSNGLKPEWDKMLRDFKKPTRTSHGAKASELLPPWLVFEYPRSSIGWRMGPGEDYMASSRLKFSSLSPRDRKSFVERYSEPEGWRGYYSEIRD
jgi:hypothetical protein